MIKREELLKTREYWFETLQNEIFRMVTAYIQKENITQTKLAEQLGVSKGYISQIVNGNFNFSLKKMIELSLALNHVPDFKFKDLGQYIEEDKQKRKMNSGSPNKISQKSIHNFSKPLRSEKS
jgi:transcriptional regulator with XRE-family HTH domain